MKIGIGSYTFAWNVGVRGYPSPTHAWGWRELIDFAIRSQIPLVQIADNLPLSALPTEDLHALRDMAEQYGIMLEVGTRGSESVLLQEYIEICKVLHSRLLRTLIMHENLAEVREDILQILPQLSESGIVLAIENHGLHRSEELAQFVSSFDSPWVGICLDTVNSFGALEAPSTVMDTLLPLARNVHVKDYSIERVDHQMGYNVRGTAAGYGKLNVEQLLDRVQTHPRQPTVILELWTPYQETVDKTAALERMWAEQSLDYLKPWMHS